MIKLLIYCSVSFLIGIIIAILLKKILSYSVIQSGVEKCWNGIVTRFDKAVTGNDGCYSHTRLMLMAWGISNIFLVWIACLFKLEISQSAAWLMGAGMGVSTAQAIFNKVQEVKNFINNKEDNNNVE